MNRKNRLAEVIELAPYLSGMRSSDVVSDPLSVFRGDYWEKPIGKLICFAYNQSLQKVRRLYHQADAFRDEGDFASMHSCAEAARIVQEFELYIDTGIEYG